MRERRRRAGGRLRRAVEAAAEEVRDLDVRDRLADRNRRALTRTGRAREIDGAVWNRSTRARGLTTLRVGSLPARLASTHAAILGALAGAPAAISGHAALGVWHVTVSGTPPETVAGIVSRMRDSVADHEGYVVVTGGPADVRGRVDPWGPVPGPALALMRSIKQTFDPERRLNPGRFVDGL